MEISTEHLSICQGAPQGRFPGFPACLRSPGLFHHTNLISNSEAVVHHSQKIPALVSKSLFYLSDKLSTKHPDLLGPKALGLCKHPLFWREIFSAHLYQQGGQDWGGNGMFWPGGCLASSSPCPERLAPRGDPRGTQCLPLARASRRKWFMLLQSVGDMSRSSAAFSSLLRSLFSARSWWLERATCPPPST